ncbi:uncharacterized protein VTP21DRAFT_8734 [Calcarisporiella thermophila]|uniref:uncharacterized protein n=1 Tax=Calcarisporiella thermophila TaxID=911321 RepID=UPI003743F41C
MDWRSKYLQKVFLRNTRNNCPCLSRLPSYRTTLAKNQRFNKVVALGHDIALWIIYRSRLELVLDDAQPNPVAITKKFDHELKRGIKSKWAMAMKQDRKKDFIDKWSRGNWVNIIDDSVILTQDTSEDQIPVPTPA